MNNCVRTNTLRQVLCQKKTLRNLISLKALLVLEAGIEPARPKSLDFESSASTNSATRALICRLQKYKNN